MDNFQLDEKSGIPVWIQLRNRLLYLITSGYYKAGDQLPTTHNTAIMLKINYNTVNKVYSSLERDGYIVSKRGLGTFVTDSSEWDESIISNTTDLITDEYIVKMKELGLTAIDITKLIETRLNESTKKKRG